MTNEEYTQNKKIENMVADLSDACDVDIVLMYLDTNDGTLRIKSTYDTIEATRLIINQASKTISNI